MKKIILLTTLVFATGAFSQTNTTTTAPDTTTSPSGVGFGGALGGANSPATPNNIPTNTQPRGNDFNSTTIQQDQERIQEQQEQMDATTPTETNPMGGGLGGGGGIDNSSPVNLNSTNPAGTAPSTAPGAAPATGVGTGVPSSP